RSAPIIAGIWMDAIEAFALAQVKDRSALNRLDNAEARLSRAAADEPVWPWIFRFDERKLAGFRAQVAGSLGRVGVAENALRIAIDPYQAPKPRAVMDLLRADVLVQSGNVDEACRVATEAFDVGKTYGSERVTRAVATFRNKLGKRPGQAVAALDERLYSTYREEP
ncbi:hypothetical protein ACN27G_36740, partial [Plantactinospora sp. WMMB334]